MQKNQTFTLWPNADPQVMQNLQSILINRNPEIAMDVTIGPHKKETRSDRQNRGYWGVWMPCAALHFGKSKDEVHNGWKEMFARVYMADPRTDIQKEWVTAYNDVKTLGGSREQLKRIKSLCSSTWADTEQFAMAMNDIDQAMHDRGLILPEIDPEKKRGA
jgi:hypothetical protein